MDSLKTIYDRGDFSLLLSITEKTPDPESLFYRASAFLSLNRPNEAMEIFEKNRKSLFLFNPLATIKHNFELRILLHEFDEAYNDLDVFRSFPYVSQSVEEKLASLPAYLRKKEKESIETKPLSIEEAKKILLSHENDVETLLTLEAVSKNYIDPFLDEIKALLVSNAHPSVRTYAFLLLISARYDKKVSFLKNGTLYHLVPKETEPPFRSARYRNFKDDLFSLAKDPSVAKVAYSLFSDYTLILFPKSPFEEDDKLLELSFYSLALDYLRVDNVSLENNPDGISFGDIENKKKEISSLLSSIPPLGE